MPQRNETVLQWQTWADQTGIGALPRSTEALGQVRSGAVQDEGFAMPGV